MDLTLHVEESFIYKWLCKWQWFQKHFESKIRDEKVTKHKEDSGEFLSVKNNKLQPFRSNLLQKFKRTFLDLKDDSINDDIRSLVRR